MRLALLAGLVVVAAAVAAVVVDGRDDGTGEPPWGRQASAACERGLTAARAVVAEAEAVADLDRRAVTVYGGVTRVEATVLDELEALPRPAGREHEIAAALRILSDSHDADVAAVATLERRFDPELLERRVNETVPVAADLRGRFLALEADGCARYLSPAAYG